MTMQRPSSRCVLPRSFSDVLVHEKVGYDRERVTGAEPGRRYHTDGTTERRRGARRGLPQPLDGRLQPSRACAPEGYGRATSYHRAPAPPAVRAPGDRHERVAPELLLNVPGFAPDFLPELQGGGVRRW